jgi:hypothetical protein
MLETTDQDRISKTHRVVTIHWSAMGKAERRKQRWGGKVAAWHITKVHDALYIIPNSVNIGAIHDALMEVLAPSDRAAFTYPYGETKSQASSMTVRLYGKAARDHKKSKRSR